MKFPDAVQEETARLLREAGVDLVCAVRRDRRLGLVTGRLLPGSTLTTVADVSLPYDDQASNPFLHTFHPDHDNLDHSRNPKVQLARGLTSYDINRRITLTLNSVGTDFDSLTQYGRSFRGAYNETISLVGIGGAPRTFNVAGTFLINRISPIAVLTVP